MEKNIKLVLTENKDIEIYVNSINKFKIPSDKKEITAEEIYNIFDYTRGDTYTVTSENIPDADKPVLGFFKSLFEEIKEGIDNFSEIKN